MRLTDFLLGLIPLKLSSLDQALAVIWFHDLKSDGKSLLPGTITRHIKASGLGNPNSTQLAGQLRRSKHTLESTKGFRLKPTGKAYVAEKVRSVLQGKPKVDHTGGFLPKHVWENTRDYIESTARQVNGCYQFGFYDGASVLIRRLVETLLIEAYEHENTETRIRGHDGDYVMLSGIINDAVDRNGLRLGRDSKKSLKSLKELGDRSAHNRRFCAGKADLDKLHSGLRVVVEELIRVANLRRPTNRSQRDF